MDIINLSSLRVENNNLHVTVTGISQAAKT